jgi:hypothetical protein
VNESDRLGSETATSENTLSGVGPARKRTLPTNDTGPGAVRKPARRYASVGSRAASVATCARAGAAAGRAARAPRAWQPVIAIGDASSSRRGRGRADSAARPAQVLMCVACSVVVVVVVLRRSLPRVGAPARAGRFALQDYATTGSLATP